MSRTPDQITLRQSKEADKPFIESILTDAGLTTDGIPEHLEWLYLGWLDEKPIAVGGIEPAGQYALLRSIVTLPEFRGKKYGQKFCELLIMEARGLDFRGLYLLTENAEQFFARLGFKKVDRSSVPDKIASTKEFSEICPNTATCMSLAL